jgi:4-amino-4-deoxy-L-arabinose transferase-like glycosyltransferase
MDTPIAACVVEQPPPAGLTRLIASRWSAAGVLALAGGLRLVNLGGRPMWYDEAFAVLYAEKSLPAMLSGTLTQVQGTAADVHSLLFYLLLHAWMRMVGQSPLAVRTLSVLLGLMTIGVIYLLARRLLVHPAGLAAAGIVTLSPFHVYYSQEARMYALLALAGVTMVYFFVRAWGQAGSWRSWVAFGVCGAVTLYAHNLGFAFVAGLDVWIAYTWLWRGSQRWRNLRPVLLAHLLMLGLFAPWLAAVPAQFGKVQQAYWVAQPGLAQLIQTIVIFHFAYDNQALPGWLLPPALFVSLLTVAILTLNLARLAMNDSVPSLAINRRADGAKPAKTGAGTKNQDCAGPSLPAPCSLLPTPYSLLLCSTGVPILLLFMVSQWRPVYIVRALLPSGLMYAVLLAGVLVVGRVPKAIRWGLLLPSAAICVAALLNHYSYARFPRAPFDQAAAYLRAHSQPADVIVHSNKLTFLPTHYYDRSLPQTFIADEPGSPADTLAYPTQEALGLFAAPDLATAVHGYQRVWFVIFRRAVDEYRAAGYPDHPQRSWLEQHYTLVSVASFNDLDVYQYETGPARAAFHVPEASR